MTPVIGKHSFYAYKKAFAAIQGDIVDCFKSNDVYILAHRNEK